MRRDLLRPALWGSLVVALALATSAGVLMRYARAPNDVPRSVALSDALAKANARLSESERQLQALDERLREEAARLQGEIDANRLAASGLPKTIGTRTWALDQALAKLKERIAKLGAMAEAGEPYLPPKPPPMEGSPQGEEEEEVQPQLADAEDMSPAGNSPSLEEILSRFFSSMCCTLLPNEETAKGLRQLLEDDVRVLKEGSLQRLAEASESLARLQGQSQALEKAQAQLAATLATLSPLPPKGPPVTVAIDDSEEKWVPLWLAALTVLGSVLIAAVGTGVGTWVTMRARP